MIQKLFTLFMAMAFTLTAFGQKSKTVILEPVIQRLIDNMVLVEGGTFLMGGTIAQGDEPADYELPIHEVTVSSFAIGKYEVTQEEWEVVMSKNPSRQLGAKHPVEQVSYNDCKRFIRKLNKLTGMKFRLPTEAEWEFAAKGGRLSKNYKYAGSNDIEVVAWIQDEKHTGTHPVGLKQPNELGLYDMSGNVWEWCQDHWGYYLREVQKNPKGASSGTFYVFRGGSWVNEPWYCRVSTRNGNLPSIRSVNLGFRLALSNNTPKR